MTYRSGKFLLLDPRLLVVNVTQELVHGVGLVDGVGGSSCANPI